MQRTIRQALGIAGLLGGLAACSEPPPPAANPAIQPAPKAAAPLPTTPAPNTAQLTPEERAARREARRQQAGPQGSQPNAVGPGGGQRKEERRQTKEIQERSWWIRGDAAAALSDEQRQAMNEQLNALIQEEQQAATEVAALEQKTQEALIQGDNDSVRLNLQQIANVENGVRQRQVDATVQMVSQLTPEQKQKLANDPRALRRLIGGSSGEGKKDKNRL